MAKINTVINGDFLGNNVESVWGNVCIRTSTWGKEDISKDNIESLEYLRDLISEKNERSSEINIKFKSGKICTIWVDNDIHKKILKIWPRDRLKELLELGYKVVGFSTCFVGSAYGNSNFFSQAATALKRMHTILLQKDKNVEIVTIFDDGAEQKLGSNNTIITSSEDS